MRSKKPKTPVFPLNLRQQIFARAYIGEAKGNATQAARIAGYKGNDKTLYVVGSRMLRLDKVAAEVQRLAQETQLRRPDAILSSHDVLAGISRQAKADIANVFEADGTFDLQKAKARGVSNLIRKITRDKTGFVTSIELYDGQAAYLLMGKYYRLFDRGGYGAIEDDQEKSKQVLAKLLKCDVRQLPPANPNDVDGELVLDDDVKVEMGNEQ